MWYLWRSWITYASYLPTPNYPPHFKFGVIPHFKEIDYIKGKVKDERINVIDFRTSNIEESINSILDCEIIISSSLHGIIFSQAYGIPAILFKSFHTSKWQFKNHDYLMSVSIAPYDPISFDLVDSIDVVLLEQIYKRYKHVSLIKNNVFNIQKQLLRVAPFELKKEFCGNELSDRIEEEMLYLRKRYETIYH